MLQSKVQIDNFNWVVSLNMRGELSFYFEQLEIDEYAGLFWKGGDDSPREYYVASVEDNVLPKNISPVKVVRKLIKEVAALVNRSKINFFYFSPSTDRKAIFYINVFKTYLPLLKGEWQFQIIDDTWFYFTKVAELN
jgi:hypothetical protein